MTEAKDGILDRLSQAQPARRQARAPLPELARAADADATPVERFAAALERTGVTWELSDNPVSARLQLVTALQSDGIKRVLTWDAAHLPSPGLLDTLNVLGVETFVPDLRAAPPRLRPQEPDHRGDLLRSAGAVEVGIVAAEAGLANTGGLALQSGQGRPLLAACMPRRIVVLLPVNRIYLSVAHWLARVPGALSPMLTLLTGPSQSLDLELIRAVGIHGPRLVHVVMIGEAP